MIIKLNNFNLFSDCFIGASALYIIVVVLIGYNVDRFNVQKARRFIENIGSFISFWSVYPESFRNKQFNYSSFRKN